MRKSSPYQRAGDMPRTRETEDGQTVRAGDQIWVDRPGFGVRIRRLDHHDVEVWWDTHYAGKAYASELACVEAAIKTRARDVAIARRDIRTAKLYAAKLRARQQALTPATRARKANR